MVKKYSELFNNILQPCAITLRKDELRGNFFELHPNPAAAHSKAWVWVLSVREGAFAEAFYLRENLKTATLFKFTADAPGDDMINRFHAAAWAEDFTYIDDTINRFHDDPAHLARMECLAGENIIDLVALSQDASKILGRFVGHSSVIGYPQIPLAVGFEHKIRLFRNVSVWLDNLCAGAVLIGSADENLAWLQDCGHGIVTDNVAHGNYIQKLLRRPYVGPQVLVSA